jgi:hypothetical protein
MLVDFPDTASGRLVDLIVLRGAAASRSTWNVANASLLETRIAASAARGRSTSSNTLIIRTYFDPFNSLLQVKTARMRAASIG